MPRLYSTDLRERALLACERDGGGCAEVARRFRIGVSTLRLWRRQARDEGRRAPRPMGWGPAPLGGRLEAWRRWPNSWRSAATRPWLSTPTCWLRAPASGAARP